MKKITISLLSVFFIRFVLAQGNPSALTPVANLNLRPVNIEVPSIYAAHFPANKIVYLPDGFKAKVFYASPLLSKPRFISFSPQGVLHVADYNTGKVIALPDLNNDGIADTAITAASGLGNIHDVKFYDGAMYVTQERRVYKCIDANNDGVYENISVFIDTIAEGATQPGGGHRTRTIVFDSLNQKVYLSIGSYCNVCRETYRAIIEQYNIDGSGKRTYATGIRNAVGMALHPVTNRLWANNNGSDNQGDDIPPEWIDLIRDGGFYGYPFAHSHQVWFDFDKGADYKALKPITKADSMLVAKMLPPAALIEAHAAPMAMVFLNQSFSSLYRNGILMALRGSWNSSVYRGYKLIYLDLTDENDTTVNYVANFCTGFLTDSLAGIRWARPVGLALDANGNIYLTSDDLNRFVLLIYHDRSTGSKDNSEEKIFDVKLFPNPLFNTSLSIALHSSLDYSCTLTLRDISSREIFAEEINVRAGKNLFSFDLETLNSGIYFAFIGNQCIGKIIRN
ncbi:MAG: PQQ-dependent sugar dehydrogenase [Chitinophagales bacterium]|nr:PQQ-dependent sugar dehydrogenase [Chitinophagales bacterium]